MSVKLHTHPGNKTVLSAGQKAGDGGFTGPLRMRWWRRNFSLHFYWV